MRFFAPIDLPSGQRICRFSMVYNDINAADIMVAHLKRRAFGLNQTTFAPPATLATVSSAGANTQNVVRRANDTTIANPVVNDAAAFYYVEVDIPTFNLRLLGVQVEVKPTCP
jgi:hypothetical protein